MGKIIVAGDSISYGKWDSEGGWVARLRKYVDITYNIGRNGNLQVYNLGIPGEVVPRMTQRFASELEMRIPQNEKGNGRNLVIFAVGINDSCPNNWMTLEQTPEDIFKQNLRDLVFLAQKKNCKVVVVGLTPVNPEKSHGLLFSNEEVKKYDNFIAEICQEEKIPKLELFEILQNQHFADLLIDAVHPNDEGHEMLFKRIKDFLEDNKIFDYLAE